ncbi:hypothetical protein [Pantoea dispersa]|uniref:hypothetical protein n=1 Tax=Pantoea dispersa TaxID=59814 RepID=UPI0021C8F62B|nr:hypothetical protein [Pantoea dispersa]UXO70835.1 hypothetical protein N7977_19655 [Pantoea dispersa]
MLPIKLRLVLMFITVVTGVYIPASMMGLTFHNAFYAKQQLNCVEDTSSALMKMFVESDPADLVRKYDVIGHDLKPVYIIWITTKA